MIVNTEFIRQKIAQLLIVSLLVYSVEFNLLVSYATTFDLESNLDGIVATESDLENYDISLLADDEDEVVKEYRYNIDVSWGRMTFVYDKGVWDTEELKYKAEESYPSKNTVDGEPGWYKFDGVNNKISIINVSTINPCEFDLWVDNYIRNDTEDYENTDGESDISGITMEFYDNAEFEGDSFTSAERIYIEQATETEEKEVSYYLNIDGEPVGLGETREELGSVVIQVHKPQVESEASVAMLIDSDDEFLLDTFNVVRFDLQDLLAYNYGLEERVGPGVEIDSDVDDEDVEVATGSNATYSLRNRSIEKLNKATDSNAVKIENKDVDLDAKSITNDEVAVKLTLPNYLKNNIIDVYTTVGEYDEENNVWILGEGETSGSLELMFEFTKEAKYTIKARAGHINEKGKFKLGLSEESLEAMEDNVAVKEIKVVNETAVVASPSNATSSNAIIASSSNALKEKEIDDEIENSLSVASPSNAEKDNSDLVDLNKFNFNIFSNIIFKEDDEIE